ncbi:hypothetical protein CRG98_045395 [Punica granatum]|uniref:Myb-like domain-containing protein n=1 Tax=Punica granatum TaxID=22663 RepID=A0A2I0HR66_PUNGR|nr:hypothetical protein CRG98_045395 [Punica granatum]
MADSSGLIGAAVSEPCSADSFFYSAAVEPYLGLISSYCFTVAQACFQACPHLVIMLRYFLGFLLFLSASLLPRPWSLTFTPLLTRPSSPSTPPFPPSLRLLQATPVEPPTNVNDLNGHCKEKGRSREHYKGRGRALLGHDLPWLKVVNSGLGFALGPTCSLSLSLGTSGASDWFSYSLSILVLDHFIQNFDKFDIVDHWMATNVMGRPKQFRTPCTALVGNLPIQFGMMSGGMNSSKGSGLSFGTPSSPYSQFSSHGGLDINDDTVEVQQVGRLNSQWRWHQDELLLSAWLNTSRDSLKGADQKHEAFWVRIYRYCEENRPDLINKNSTATKKRWSRISLASMRFGGCSSLAERNRRSGESYDDMIENAIANYEVRWRALSSQSGGSKNEDKCFGTQSSSSNTEHETGEGSVSCFDVMSGRSREI